MGRQDQLAAPAEPGSWRCQGMLTSQARRVRVRSQYPLPPKLPGPSALKPPAPSPISLPPTQSCLAVPLPGGPQLQAMTSSPTSSRPGNGEEKQENEETKGIKKRGRPAGRQAPPPQFLKCSPGHSKSPDGQRGKGGRGFLHQAFKASEIPSQLADL